MKPEVRKDGYRVTGGTPCYMAPEMFDKKQRITEKVDVYSFGIMIWELFTQQRPFYDFVSCDLVTFVRAIYLDKERPPIPQEIPKLLRDCMQNCWSHNPDDRPSFKDINSEKIFENAVVDFIIKDPTGQKFWKKYCISLEPVRWELFVKYLTKFLGEKKAFRQSNPIAILRMLISPTLETKWVAMDEFANFLEFFGPFDKKIFGRMEELVINRWFFGHVGKSTNSFLSQSVPGTFFIRLSGTPGCFSLTYKNKEGLLSSMRLQRTKDNTFQFGGKEYESISHFIVSVKPHVGLLDPCLGWPFQKFYTTDMISAGYELNYRLDNK